jgi:hypothetical protein
VDVGIAGVSFPATIDGSVAVVHHGISSPKSLTATLEFTVSVTPSFTVAVGLPPGSTARRDAAHPGPVGGTSVGGGGGAGADLELIALTLYAPVAAELSAVYCSSSCPTTSPVSISIDYGVPSLTLLLSFLGEHSKTFDTSALLTGRVSGCVGSQSHAFPCPKVPIPCTMPDVGASHPRDGMLWLLNNRTTATAAHACVAARVPPRTANSCRR